MQDFEKQDYLLPSVPPERPPSPLVDDPNPYHRWKGALGIASHYYRTRAEYRDEQLREFDIPVRYIVTGDGRWQIVDTIDEARKLMSYWRKAEVYRLEGPCVKPLDIDSAVHHHALCDFSWHEGKRPCTCKGFDVLNKGLM